MEKDVSKVSGLEEIGKIKQVLEKISNFEEMSISGTIGDFNVDKMKSGEDVDSLKRMLNDINNKLKKVI